MLDSLPPMVRHLLLMLAATLLAWAGTDLVPWLEARPGVGAVAAALVTAAVAYATPLVRQYGVGSAPRDGRHELGGRDVGSARVVGAAAVGAVLLVVTAAVPAAAAWRHARTPVMPVVSTAYDCDGTLIVTFQAYRLDGRELRPVLDDGLTRVVEARDVSGRSQPDGVWLRVVSTSGGDGRARAAGWRQQRGMLGAHPDLVRVIRTDEHQVISPGVPITDGCPQ